MPTRMEHDLDAWMSVVEDLEAAEHQRSVRYNALSSLITSLESTIQAVVHEKNRLLSSLAQDLDKIMADAAAVVARLDGARNAGEAIKRGVADAWQELPTLCDQYDTIRQAQDWIMAGDHRVVNARSEYLWTDDLASDLAIANLDTVFPDWKSPARNHAIQQWDNQNRLQPWPAEPIEQLVYPELVRSASLVPHHHPARRARIQPAARPRTPQRRTIAKA
jgi:hypothetical protein